MTHDQLVYDESLVHQLMAKGYSCITFVPGRGICGIGRMAFTTGLFLGMDYTGYYGRYCFHTWYEAAASLTAWDGLDDPTGNWLKHKGGAGEYSNPNYSDNG